MALLTEMCSASAALARARSISSGMRTLRVVIPKWYHAAHGLSAFDDVDREAASGCLFVLAAHVRAGSAERLDRLVQRHEVTPVTAQSQAGRADGLDRGDRVAFDA